jgi:hypothetical protein
VLVISKILQHLVELKNHWLWLFQSSQRTGGFYETTGPQKINNFNMGGYLIFETRGYESQEPP